MSDLHQRAQSVKARWSMPTLIEHLTGDPVPANRKVHSLFNPEDNTPSMHVYDDSIFDFSTGTYADVISLIQRIKHCSFWSAIELLEEEADELKLDAVVRVKEEPKPFAVPAIHWTREPLAPAPAGVSWNMWKWLHSTHAIGYRPTFTDVDVAVPHYWYFPESHSVRDIVGVKYRLASGAKISEPGSCFTHGLYSVQCRACPSAVIVEGESDCWAMAGVDSIYADVYALPSGASTWRNEWLEQLTSYGRVFLCLDNDRAGKAARDKIHRATKWQFKDLYVPIPYGDAREAIAAGWVPSLR